MIIIVRKREKSRMPVIVFVFFFFPERFEQTVRRADGRYGQKGIGRRALRVQKRIGQKNGYKQVSRRPRRDRVLCLVHIIYCAVDP